MTIADDFAEQFGLDGQSFETPDGQSFEDLAAEMGAIVEYAKRIYSDDDRGCEYAPGFANEHISSDPIRFEFSDKSAVVVAGDAWDFEGKERFSWRG